MKNFSHQFEKLKREKGSIRLFVYIVYFVMIYWKFVNLLMPLQGTFVKVVNIIKGSKGGLCYKVEILLKIFWKISLKIELLWIWSL